MGIRPVNRIAPLRSGLLPARGCEDGGGETEVGICPGCIDPEVSSALQIVLTRTRLYRNNLPQPETILIDLPAGSYLCDRLDIVQPPDFYSHVCQWRTASPVFSCQIPGGAGLLEYFANAWIWRHLGGEIRTFSAFGYWVDGVGQLGTPLLHTQGGHSSGGGDWLNSAQDCTAIDLTQQTPLFDIPEISACGSIGTLFANCECAPLSGTFPSRIEKLAGTVSVASV